MRIQQTQFYPCAKPPSLAESFYPFNRAIAKIHSIPAIELEKYLVKVKRILVFSFRSLRYNHTFAGNGIQSQRNRRKVAEKMGRK